VEAHGPSRAESDRDEFDANRVRYGYPPDLVARAEHAASEAESARRANEPPFDGTAAQHWPARARQRTFE
jgi:uncharacterized protein